MNGFVRKVAVLSVLWALCELLLPDGKQQNMVRMTVSVLVMTALLGSFGQMLGQTADTTAFSSHVVQTAEGSYHQTALRAAANQVQSYCIRQAQKAGYAAQASVWLGMDGALERIVLALDHPQNALVGPEQLKSLLSDQLSVETWRIELEEL